MHPLTLAREHLKVSSSFLLLFWPYLSSRHEIAFSGHPLEYFVKFSDALRRKCGGVATQIVMLRQGCPVKADWVCGVSLILSLIEVTDKRKQLSRHLADSSWLCATAYLGAREATILSKQGSPRNGSHHGRSFNWP